MSQIQLKYFSYQNVAAGHVETVRYECLFGFNNSGPHFENGRFIERDQSRTEYIRSITDELVTELDNGIRVIENVANKTLSAKWIIHAESTHSGQSCLQQSLISASCWDMELGDANIPACETCRITHDIDHWYNSIKAAIGTQRDPRIPGKDINWVVFGKVLSVWFHTLKNKDLAQKVDWKKFAYLVRAFLMYALSVKLTERLAKLLDSSHYQNVDLMKELLDRYGGYKPMEYSDINFDTVGDKVEGLFDALMIGIGTDDRHIFNNMTKVEGIRFQRNEMEDYRHYGQEEFDEYVAFHYKNYTEKVGTMFGRLIATRKKVVFNPTASPFVDKMIYEIPEAEIRRLPLLGISVGQNIIFPTRRIRNENRRFLWNILEDWPPCTDAEGDQITQSEVRFKSTTPLPVITIDQSDLVTSYHEKIDTQVEML